MLKKIMIFFSYYGTERKNRMPYSFPGAYRDWIIRAIEHRYRLMPYIHTLAYDAHSSGEPIIRPMFYEFPGKKILKSNLNHAF